MDSQYIVESVESFSYLMNNVEDTHAQLSAALSEADLEVCDLRHEVEIMSFSASEGYVLAKKLKEVLIRRRQLKNSLKVISLFCNGFYNDRKGSTIPLYKTLTSIKNEVELQKSRNYNPRVRTDLKIAQIV